MDFCRIHLIGNQDVVAYNNSTPLGNLNFAILIVAMFFAMMKADSPPNAVLCGRLYLDRFAFISYPSLDVYSHNFCVLHTFLSIEPRNPCCL